MSAMQLLFPNAIRGQLLTVPSEEKAGLIAQLQYLAQNPSALSHLGQPVPDAEPGIWMVHLAGDIRAVLRVEDGNLLLLAFAREEQLKPYLIGPDKQVA